MKNINSFLIHPVMMNYPDIGIMGLMLREQVVIQSLTLLGESH